MTNQEIASKGDIEEIKNMLASIEKRLCDKMTSARRWVKGAELRKILSVSASSLQNMRINGTIPYTKLGGTIYYDLDEIDRILMKKMKNK